MFESFFIIKINFVAALVLGQQGFCCVKTVERLIVTRELKLWLYPYLDLSEYSLTSFTINSASENLIDHLIFYVTCLFPTIQSILQPLPTI
jgi:hypothetical protein